MSFQKWIYKSTTNCRRKSQEKGYLLYKEEAFAADGTDLHHTTREAILCVFSVIHLLILRIQTLLEGSVPMDNTMTVQITQDLLLNVLLPEETN